MRLYLFFIKYFKLATTNVYGSLVCQVNAKTTLAMKVAAEVSDSIPHQRSVHKSAKEWQKVDGDCRKPMDISLNKNIKLSQNVKGVPKKNPFFCQSD